MKSKEIREKKNEEIEKLLEEKLAHARALHFGLMEGSAKNTKEFASLRKDVARMRTILRERSLVEKTASPASVPEETAA